MHEAKTRRGFARVRCGLRNSGHPFVEGVYVRIFDSNLSDEG
jgi:hypothetical protein